MLEGIPVACEWMKRHAVSPAEMRTLATDQLQSLIWHPPTSQVKAYFTLNHNETFGVGKYIRTREKLPLVHCALALFSRKHHHLVKEHLNGSGWPHAMLLHNFFGVSHQLLASQGKLSRI